MQTVRAVITLDMPIPLTADYHQYWLFYNRSGTLGTLETSVAETDTQIVLAANLPAVGGIAMPGVPVAAASAFEQLAIGSTIAVDDEPMRVTARDAMARTLTVERYPAAFSYVLLAPTKTHAAGSSVFALTYKTVFELIAEKYLRPHTYDLLKELGSNSYSLGTLASGTLTASGAIANSTAQSPAEG